MLVCIVYLCRFYGTLGTKGVKTNGPISRKPSEPVQEIMVLFVLHKLILQTRMPSHPVGQDVWFLVGPFVYFHTSCLRTAKALARLRGCAGSPESSLVAYVISTIISWAGSNGVKTNGSISRKPSVMLISQNITYQVLSTFQLQMNDNYSKHSWKNHILTMLICFNPLTWHWDCHEEIAIHLIAKTISYWWIHYQCITPPWKKKVSHFAFLNVPFQITGSACSHHICRLPMKTDTNENRSWSMGGIPYGPRQANLCLRAFRHDKFQLRMPSHSEGQGIWFSVWRFLLIHCLYERAAKVLARLRGCAGSPEPSLLA